MSSLIKNDSLTIDKFYSDAFPEIDNANFKCTLWTIKQHLTCKCESIVELVLFSYKRLCTVHFWIWSKSLSLTWVYQQIYLSIQIYSFFMFPNSIKLQCKNSVESWFCNLCPQTNCRIHLLNRFRWKLSMILNCMNRILYISSVVDCPLAARS